MLHSPSSASQVPHAAAPVATRLVAERLSDRLAALPTLLMYLFGGKYFMSGLTAGAVK